jgi:hypothetical protein
MASPPADRDPSWTAEELKTNYDALLKAYKELDKKNEDPEALVAAPTLM